MLFVHGFACDSNDWIWQLPHFTASRRVIAADLRGHGRSTAPAHGYTPSDFADDLAQLLEQLGCGPVVAVGHSLGGLVVSLLAVERPQLVRAVVAVDPAYLVDPGTLWDVAPLIDALEASDPVHIVQAMLQRADGPSTPPFLRAWHRRRAAGVDEHVLCQTLLNMSPGPGSLTAGTAGVEVLERRACPVLSVFTHPARSEAERAHFSGDGSRSVTWQGAGHWLHQERPEDFNRLVDEWLESF
jgi:pimeloyl-ACP methyl ester carboxylesterase